jgi:hypothetical protein
MDWILTRHPSIAYPTFIQETFRDIYFTEEENAWLDQTITNIHQMTDSYKAALAFFALAQAAIIKRPYNLFHRKNLYVRLAEVERSFGNKTSGIALLKNGFAKSQRKRTRPSLTMNSPIAP